MKTKFILIFIAFLLVTNVFSQTNLNEYKYVIVPAKFDFLKEADKYQLNSLTKFLFEKEGFTTLFENSDLPEDLKRNRCLALFSNVLSDSGMLKTKLSFELKDCNNKVVFKSQLGASREKEYKKSYHEALRNAFKSLKEVNYSYTPKVEQKVVEVKPKETKVIVAPVKIESSNKIEPVKETPKVEKPIIKETPKNLENIEEVKKPIAVKPVINETPNTNILYAQEIANGFQLVDSSPKIVIILLSTPRQDVYIVKGKDAIVYKEEGFWYMAKGATNHEKLNIKF